MRLAQALFAPRAVALIGASGDPKKNTARPQRYLRKHGYTGRIVPVNATRGEVLGERAYKSVAEAPVDIDHAFIMVEEVEQALEDCGRKRIPVASIYSNGFADAGAEGAKRQAKLVERARELGIRLLGPNSMGVVDLPGHVALTVNAILEMDAPPTGGTSLVSQSGTMLGTLLSRGAARGLGYAKLVSIGNEADLGVGELVELLVDDTDTKVIALFLETVRDAERLARAARKAHAAGKPIVAYKLGRSALGEELARTHTGALAGTDAALDAYFRDCGIVRVDMLETLVEIPPLLSGRAPSMLRRPARVAVVTTTGGGAASVVDRLGLQGLQLASMHDLTMTSTQDIYRTTLEKLLASPDCDAVLAAVGSSAQFHPDFAVQPILQAKRTAKPLAAFLTPHAERSLALLAEKGIAAFRTPEACADAFAAFFAWRTPRDKFGDGARTDVPADPFSAMASLGIPVAEHAVVQAPDFRHSLPYPVALKRLDVEHKTEACADAFAAFFAWRTPRQFGDGARTNLPSEPFAAMQSLGIPVAERAIVQAPHFKHSLAYPVVLKRLDVEHKTEVGGVVLNIGSQAELVEHAKRMGHSRLLVQRMERGLAEAIIGYRRDPIVGPLVLVGAGGTLAELYKDVAIALAPVTEAEALALLERVTGLAIVRGYRNLPRGDVAALARAVAALSRLAGTEVLEAEINPLIIKADGVIAVDARMVLK